MFEHAGSQHQPPRVIGELRDAQEQLARMFTLLDESYDELVASLGAATADAADDGSLPEIDHFVAHAAAALHYESRASQLITLSLNRLALARRALKKTAVAPKNSVTGDTCSA